MQMIRPWQQHLQLFSDLWIDFVWLWESDPELDHHVAALCVFELGHAFIPYHFGITYGFVLLETLLKL